MVACGFARSPDNTGPHTAAPPGVWFLSGAQLPQLESLRPTNAFACVCPAAHSNQSRSCRQTLSKFFDILLARIHRPRHATLNCESGLLPMGDEQLATRRWPGRRRHRASQPGRHPVPRNLVSEALNGRRIETNHTNRTESVRTEPGLTILKRSAK